MDKNNTFINFILISAFIFLFGCKSTAENKMNPDLARKIQQDERLWKVKTMAEDLLKEGLNAGDAYNEIWIRDLNTFIELACKAGDVNKIRESLLTFFKLQGADGNIVDGYVKKTDAHVSYNFYYSDLAPEFAAHKNTVETDQESSLIQAVAKYIHTTGDVSILKEEIGGKTVDQRMEDALNFLMNEKFDEKYGLLWGATTADWGDVQPEHDWGVNIDSTSHLCIDIYDNAMCIIAIKDYLQITQNNNKKHWNKVSAQISSNVRKHLWDKKNQKFIPHIYLDSSPFPADFDENAIYYHGGTAIAIEAGLLSKDEIRASYIKMKENVKAAQAQSIGLTLYPVYPNGFFKNKGMGEYSYQNGGDWTWFGGRMVQQLIANGFYDEAYEAILPMLDRTIKHNNFFEWWTPNGTPHNGNFRGSAGVLWKAIVMFEAEEDFTQYVNPNIGTVHSRWFFYTPASLPFGMAKLAPSTNGSYGNHSGWEAVGYEDGHTSIEGFACFHEFQVGGVMLMPVVGKIKPQPGRLENPADGFRSNFVKNSETASPGYYSVTLQDYDTKVALTATERVGFQQYIFPETDSASIIFDIGNQLGESGAVKDAHIRRVDNHTIEGFVTTLPEYIKKYQHGADLTMYFYAKIDKPIKESVVFHRGETPVSGNEIDGIGSTMAIGFNTIQNEKILVKIGLSYTSVENAKLNYETEAASKSFEEVKQNAHAIWNEKLGRIKVTGGAHEDKIKFYTGLYHAILGRGLASDVNGAYPKNDGGIGQIETNAHGVPMHHHYNTDAVWGAFWNLTQLWTLAYPEYFSDWVKSQLLVYKETGWLGDGIANSKYVSGVGTNFTSLAIAAAYNCGIRDFDVNMGYEAALKNEIESKDRIEGAGKMDVGLFVEMGYAPYVPEIQWTTTPEGSMFGTSHTLEYAFSSFAVSEFAKALGKKEDYKLLQRLSKGWELVFDEETKLMRPRLKNGEFLKPFNKLAPWIGFQEGNAVQYTFYVPHDIEKLIQRVGEDKFNTRLDSIFTLSQLNVFGGGKEINAFSGLQALYNHGNQPNLHTSWLFNFSGRPYLTQKWTRAICDEFYGTDGVHGYGYGQDEDQGQLGAWYVMAAMGLFDVKGLTEANPQMQVGSPLFDRIEITLNNNYYKGKSFVIETENNSKENIYIQSVTLNGKKQESVFIPFNDIISGGSIKLNMGENPN